jgi:large conductance mechanosensitive channel
LLPFLGKNIQERFSVLRPGPNYDEWQGYNTIKQAQEDGAVIMSWG